MMWNADAPQDRWRTSHRPSLKRAHLSSTALTITTVTCHVFRNNTSHTRNSPVLSSTSLHYCALFEHALNCQLGCRQFHHCGRQGRPQETRPRRVRTRRVELGTAKLPELYQLLLGVTKSRWGWLGSLCLSIDRVLLLRACVQVEANYLIQWTDGLDKHVAGK